MKRTAILTILALGALLLAQCGSDDTPETAQNAPARQSDTAKGSFMVPGSSDQILWIKGLTDAFQAAKVAYSLHDTAGAIYTAESLLTVAEQAVDTLPPQDQMSRFVLIYTSDVYGSLRKWYLTGGQREAAEELSTRYEDLAYRMQQRRDSVSRIVP